MAAYVRQYQKGGTYFFTLVAEKRMPIFNDPANTQRFRDSLSRCRESLPFDVIAGVILPDHVHLILTLPEDDGDFSTRLRFIKLNFTDRYLAAGGREQPRSDRKQRVGERGVWQSRFWEHRCRDERDLARHVEYIHFNPVKHGVARCPHEWPASSFHPWVGDGRYERDWCCVCDDHTRPDIDWSWANDAME